MRRAGSCLAVLMALACLAAVASPPARASFPALMGSQVLMIGDSHLVYMSQALHDELLARGASVHTQAVCGSVPGDWLVSATGDCGGAERTGLPAPAVSLSTATTTPVEQLIGEDQPDLVVIVLGDNLAGYGLPQFPLDWATRQVSDLNAVMAASGLPCAWIGPSWGQPGQKLTKTDGRVREVSRFLQTHVTACAYVDSLQFSRPGEWKTQDGMHLTAGSYRYWANAIAATIEAYASGPAVVR